VPAARAIWPPLPGFSSMLWTIVPIGMPENGIALPGLMSALARDDLVADAEALRRQDIGLLAIFIADERDEGGPVRVVFDPLDGRRTSILVRLKSTIR
jgi:hypothetical protein